MKFHTIALGCLLALTVLGTGCGSSTEEKSLESGKHLKELVVAVQAWHNASQAWPDTLADVAMYTEGEQRLKMLLQNPLTGDDPGYEYVKPDTDQVTRDTVLIYQLHDGKRDTSLAAAYGDGSVRQPD